MECDVETEKKSTDVLIITTAAAMANAFSTKHTEIC